MSATSIVTVNVTQDVAPNPLTLQSSGAMISQGGTTTAAGTVTLLTQESDLAAILKGALALSNLTWSGSVVTATASAAHGLTVSDQVWIKIQGVTPSGYNGTYLCTITSSTQFTYALASNPGATTVPGTYLIESAVELAQMVHTFFAQGSGTAVSVLELGAGSPADGIDDLDTYITQNPNSNYVPGAAGYFYSYLLPRKWTDEADLQGFLNSFVALTARTYFFITATVDNYTDFAATQKCAVIMVESATAASNEFSCAAPFWVTLHYAPSSTNLITPTAFSFLSGVTAYPTRGNSTILTALKAASTNVVGTGAEGGITNAILLFGTARDGKDFTYWYSVDWVQLNSDIDISNEIINGSNNPLNPLYYNQAGINRLQAVVVRMMKQAISYGLALGQVITTQLSAADFQAALNAGDFAGQVVINAESFVDYSAANPSDYALGQYNGLSVVYTPSRGFTHITFNVHVTNFVTA